MHVSRISTIFLGAIIAAATGCGGSGSPSGSSSGVVGNSSSGATGATSGNTSSGATTAGSTSSGATSAGGSGTLTAGGSGTLTAGGSGTLTAGGSGTLTAGGSSAGGVSAGGTSAGSAGGTSAGSAGGTSAGSAGGTSAGGSGTNPAVPAGGYKIFAFDIDMALAGIDGYAMSTASGMDETWVILNADATTLQGLQIMVGGSAVTPLGALQIGTAGAQGGAPASLIEIGAITADNTPVQVVVTGGAAGGSGSSNTVTVNPSQFKSNLNGVFAVDNPQDGSVSAAYEPQPVQYTWEAATGAVSYVVLNVYCDLDSGLFLIDEAVQVPAGTLSLTAGSPPSGSTVFYDQSQLTQLDPNFSWTASFINPNNTANDQSQFYGFSVLSLDSTGSAIASTQVDLAGNDWNWFDVQ